MSLSDKDRTTLRDLATRLAEIAALPVQQEKAALWRRLNRLERTRPLVLLQNATWQRSWVRSSVPLSRSAHVPDAVHL